MKKLLSAFVSLTALFIVSCQKEISMETGGNPGSSGVPASSSALLTKTVSTSGSDSSVTDFIYNTANKLIGMNLTIDTAGISSYTSQAFIRNAQGIIEKIIIKGSALTQYGIDSEVTNIHYDAGLARYTSSATIINVLGYTVKDSSFFIYDASGKIITQESYVDNGTGGITKARIDFTYSGSNLASIKIYDYNSGSANLDLTETIEYDSKPSPLILGNEAFAINSPAWYSSNNIVKVTTNLSTDPQTHVETYSYTYNSVNKPQGASVLQDGKKFDARFYYN